MELSTRSRYAVEAILYMASATRSMNIDGVLSLSNISEATYISISYLEQIFAKLRRGNIVSSVKGVNGGYRLAKEIDDIYISDIVRAADELLETRGCKGMLEKNGQGCKPGGSKCYSHYLWDGLLSNINGYLSTISITDVLDGEIKKLSTSPIDDSYKSNVNRI